MWLSHQILISEEHLARGLFGISEVPGSAVAVLRRSPDELAATLGITFQSTHDSLDDILVAVLELPDGTEISIQHLKGLPPGEVELMVTTGDALDPSIIERVLPQIGARGSDVVWRAPAQASSAAPESGPS